MILLIIVLSIAWAGNAQAATTYDFTIKEVYDGDTVKIKEMYLNALPISVRIRGIDTPEKSFRAKCIKEKKLASKATKKLKKIIKNSSVIYYKNVGWDKYGGRILADMYNEKGNIADQMIAAGLAYKYDGGKKKSWCD